MPGARHALATLVVLPALALPGIASAATITVNGTGDAAANDGVCTLREAITAANSNASSGGAVGECGPGQAEPTQDAIHFSIAGAGPHTIALATALPNVTELVVIDGGTDTNPGPSTDEIRIDGSGSTGSSALRLSSGSDGSTVRDLSVYSFTGDGIVVTTQGNSIEGCFAGTNQSGTAGIGNGGSGISLGGADNEVDGNVLSGNGFAGVITFTSGSTITSNRIGTTPNGSAALPNASGGVQLTQQSDDTVVGGPGLDGNLISGNGGVGITASQTISPTDAAENIVIEGNRIGTKLGGVAALPNTNNGIQLQGDISGATIKGNLISGNGADGIALNASPTQPTGAPGPAQNTIKGNLVGTDVTGAVAVPNTGEGASIAGGVGHTATGNTLGGTLGLTPGGACTGDCNLLSGNINGGATVGQNASGTDVLGNFVGSDVTGTADLGNTGNGVTLNSAAQTQLGEPGAENLVGGNSSVGILVGFGSTGNEVQSNLVGLQTDGAGDLGNDGAGIAVNASTSTGNLIGGTAAGEGNTIANNGTGVHVQSGTANPILGNSIDGNPASLGINLDFDGVTANDPGDADTGPNGLQNYPVLSGAITEGGSTVVAGTLDSTADTDFRVEVFSSATADPSGFGEGETSLGSFVVTTDGTGTAPFVQTVGSAAPAASSVTATATKLDGAGDPVETSEFSAALTEGCDVTGTPGDDPALTGTPAGEVICGLGGDDVIDGGGGDDVIVGGDGTDEVDYSSASGAIDADLGAGAVTGAGAGSDLAAAVEDVTGSDFDDTVTGDDNANTLVGGDGKDTLNGEDAKDTLKGKDGGDTLDGGNGKDTLQGKDGKDTLKGKDDADTLDGGDSADELKGGDGDKDDLDAGAGKDSLDGGDGKKDVCDGGPDHDDTPAPGCETKKHIP